MSPKFFHSLLQKTLLRLIENCCKGKDRITPEWAVVLQRNGRDWVPTPDLTYVSYDRLPKQWKRNEACPVPCTLEIEIVSHGQTFDEFEEKARDYLNAGCDREREDMEAMRELFVNRSNPNGKVYPADFSEEGLQQAEEAL